MILSRGDGLAFASVVLWSLFPVITKISHHRFPPVWSACFTLALSCLFFLIYAWRFRFSLRIHPSDFSLFLRVLFFNGVLYYGCMFYGLQFTSAGNGALLSLLEVFFSYLILTFILRHESFIPVQFFGACFMLCGAAWILLPHMHLFAYGDFFIIAATPFPSFGNTHMQSLRSRYHGSVIFFWRTLLSLPFFLFFAYLLHGVPHVSSLSFFDLLPFLLSGFFVLGYSKVLWLDALLCTPITRAVSFIGLQPMIALLSSFLLLRESVTVYQLGSLPFFLLGIFFILSTRPDLGSDEVEP